MRIGYGTDTHRLTFDGGHPLKLGGIVIPADFGTIAHSDGDTLIHALIDALLGAAALGDIGELFPPDQAVWKDADSGYLLSAVAEQVTLAGYMIGNIDTVIHLEHPKLKHLKQDIARSLARLTGTDAGRISVKAKTGEGLGPVGRGEAVTAEAVVLLGEPEPDIWV